MKACGGGLSGGGAVGSARNKRHAAGWGDEYPRECGRGACAAAKHDASFCRSVRIRYGRDVGDDVAVAVPGVVGEVELIGSAPDVGSSAAHRICAAGVGE